MFKYILSLFHRHDIVRTSRTLVGHGAKCTNMGCSIDIDETNIYLVERYCIKCKKQFISKKEILAIFDRHQPYDNEAIKPKNCSTCRYLFIENENILECSKLDITQVEEDFYCKYFKLKE